MDRKIPSIMGTQHPDNAGVPFFKHNDSPSVSAFREIDEAYQNFSKLVPTNTCGTGKVNTPMLQLSTVYIPSTTNISKSIPLAKTSF